MSALIEYQELIDLVAGTIAKLKGGANASSHSFRTQQDCELYEGVGSLAFEQLPPKVRDAISILLSPLNNDLIPEHQQFQRDWTGSFPDKNNGRSDGDLTLCGSLARAGLQSKEIDMALRASGRYREKWEREDYRRRTISLALTQVVGSANDEEPPFSAAPSDWLSEMNERHAVVRTGADLFVMDFHTPNASAHGTGYGPELMKVSTFKLMLAGQYVSVDEGKTVPKGIAWLNSPKRCQYEGIPMLTAFEDACNHHAYENFHIERFSIKEPVSTDMKSGYTIELKKSGKFIAVAAGQSVLDALLAANRRTP